MLNIPRTPRAQILPPDNDDWSPPSLTEVMYRGKPRTRPASVASPSPTPSHRQDPSRGPEACLDAPSERGGAESDAEAPLPSKRLEDTQQLRTPSRAKPSGDADYGIITTGLNSLSIRKSRPTQSSTPNTANDDHTETSFTPVDCERAQARLKIGSNSDNEDDHDADQGPVAPRGGQYRRRRRIVLESEEEEENVGEVETSDTEGMEPGALKPTSEPSPVALHLSRRITNAFVSDSEDGSASPRTTPWTPSPVVEKTHPLLPQYPIPSDDVPRRATIVITSDSEDEFVSPDSTPRTPSPVIHKKRASSTTPSSAPQSPLPIIEKRRPLPVTPSPVLRNAVHEIFDDDADEDGPMRVNGVGRLGSTPRRLPVYSDHQHPLSTPHDSDNVSVRLRDVSRVKIVGQGWEVKSTLHETSGLADDRIHSPARHTAPGDDTTQGEDAGEDDEPIRVRSTFGGKGRRKMIVMTDSEEEEEEEEEEEKEKKEKEEDGASDNAGSDIEGRVAEVDDLTRTLEKTRLRRDGTRDPDGPEESFSASDSELESDSFVVEDDDEYEPGSSGILIYDGPTSTKPHRITTDIPSISSSESEEDPTQTPRRHDPYSPPPYTKTRAPATPRSRAPVLLTPVRAASAMPKRAFTERREAMAREIFVEMNAMVFKEKLPGEMEIKWSKTLNTTAGRAWTSERKVNGQTVRCARIELSTKVVDDVDKLRNTLAHELCHAAAWVIDGISKPPHGKAFKYWGARASSAYPDVCVTTCHNYEIEFKFQWNCITCGKGYGRHSKSIDPAKQVCGLCRGRLQPIEKVKKDGTPVANRQPNRFQLYLKVSKCLYFWGPTPMSNRITCQQFSTRGTQENMKRVKDTNPHAAHAEVMSILASEYRVQRAREAIGGGAMGEGTVD